MIEQLKEWITDPRVVAAIGLFIGGYILCDIVRAFLYIFDSSRSAARRQKRKRSWIRRKLET